MGDIGRDEGMDRTYIPLPGGFEVQTKGKGSTFRIYDGENDFRLPVCDQPYLFDILERMARASHEANRELTRQVEQLQAEVDEGDRARCMAIDLIAELQARVDAAEKLVAKWRVMLGCKNATEHETKLRCANELEAALIAPPSSSDPGRNDSKGIEGDTGREER